MQRILHFEFIITLFSDLRQKYGIVETCLLCNTQVETENKVKMLDFNVECNLFHYMTSLNSKGK